MDISKYVKGYSLLVGVCAGYFTHKAMEDKASELVQEGGLLNAFLIGAGVGSITVTVACASANIVKTFLTEMN